MHDVVVLAMSTSTTPSAWLAEDPAVLATALQLLEEQQQSIDD